MTTPELSPELRQSFANLQSVYQLKDRTSYGREDLDEAKIVLPISIDDLNEITTEYECPMVGLLQEKGIYEIEAGAWNSNPNVVKLLVPQHWRYGENDPDKIQIKDLGNGTIETSVWNAHVLRRELAGSPPLTIEDVELLYKRELESYKPGYLPPFIGLSKNVSFGDFIEKYPHLRDAHEDHDWDDSFDEACEDVLLKPDFYMELHRYVVRKGWIKEDRAFVPLAVFHRSTGFLRVFLIDEWDAGGAHFNFGGDLEENPGVLSTVEIASGEGITETEKSL